MWYPLDNNHTFITWIIYCAQLDNNPGSHYSHTLLSIFLYVTKPWDNIWGVLPLILSINVHLSLWPKINMTQFLAMQEPLYEESPIEVPYQCSLTGSLVYYNSSAVAKHMSYLLTKYTDTVTNLQHTYIFEWQCWHWGGGGGYGAVVFAPSAHIQGKTISRWFLSFKL